MDISFSCCVCGLQINKLKRCTRCKRVYYCSRECQVKDWSTHRQSCKSPASRGHADSLHSSSETLVFSKRNCIDEKHCELVPKNVNVSKDGKSYLYKNERRFDVPILDESESYCMVTLKFNRTKEKVFFQNKWTGEDIWKVIACVSNIPYEKLTVIQKGRKLSAETVKEDVRDKAVLLVLGEMAEDETGVDSEEVQILMKQMSVDRNDAIKAMKKCGNLIDAILDIGSK